MRKRLIPGVIFCIVTIFNATFSNAQNSPIIFQQRVERGSNFIYSLFIGSDSALLNKVYLESEQSDFLRPIRSHKHLLRQETVAYIAKCLYINCKIADQDTKPIGENFYSMNPYQEGSPLCYLQNKEDAKRYFMKLKRMIETSPYKGECKYLLKDLQKKFIENRSFSFTQEEERQLRKYKGKHSRK